MVQTRQQQTLNPRLRRGTSHNVHYCATSSPTAMLILQPKFTHSLFTFTSQSTILFCNSSRLTQFPNAVRINNTSTQWQFQRHITAPLFRPCQMVGTGKICRVIATSFDTTHFEIGMFHCLSQQCSPPLRGDSLGSDHLVSGVLYTLTCARDHGCTHGSYEPWISVDMNHHSQLSVEFNTNNHQRQPQVISKTALRHLKNNFRNLMKYNET